MSVPLSFGSELLQGKQAWVWYSSLISTVWAPAFSFLSDTAAYRIGDLKPDH